MATGVRPYLILTLLCLCVFLPGLTVIPPLDRDEARFAQATRQMIETGDVLDIRFQDQARYKKPAGAYWLQAVAVHATGEAEQRSIWPHRLPSAIAAWAAVLLTFAVGARLFDRTTALLGAALLGGSVMLILEAHQAKADALLLVSIVAAQLALARIWLGCREGGEGNDVLVGAGSAWVVFWLAQAAGLLIKGPITPMISALTILALAVTDWRWRWLGGLRVLKGATLLAIIVVPWGVATWIATDGAFFATAIGTDLAPKLISGQESHGAPPGYYIGLLIVLFWPGSLLVFPALVQAWHDRRVAAVRYCLAWIVPAWIVFEAVPTKLPHYVLPLFPALALLVAHAILQAGAATDIKIKARLTGITAKVFAVIWAIVGVAFAVAVVAAPIVVGDGLSAWSLIPAVLAFATVVVSIRYLWHGAPLRASLSALGLGALTLASTLLLVVPLASQLWISERLAEAVRVIDTDRARPVVIAGFAEPSAVFLLGTATELSASGAAAAAFLADHDNAIAVIDAAELPSFEGAIQGVPPAVVGRVMGLNYSKGRPIDLTVHLGTDAASEAQPRPRAEP